MDKERGETGEGEVDGALMKSPTTMAGATTVRSAVVAGGRVGLRRDTIGNSSLPYVCTVGSGFGSNQSNVTT